MAARDGHPASPTMQAVTVITLIILYYTVVKFEAMRSLAIPPAPRHSMVGGSRLTQKNLPGPNFSFQASGNCCDSVAMRAVSSR